VWFLLRERPDVVQAHELYSTLLGVPAAWLARVPTILSSRRNLGYWWWYTPRRRVVLRWIEGLSTFVIANSQAVSDVLTKEDGMDSRRIRVVRNGIDIQDFENVPPDRPSLFPQFGSGDKLIAAVANMNTQTKGHTDLLHAAAEVCRDFPRARFLLVGDGCERARLEDLTRQLNLEANVIPFWKPWPQASRLSPLVLAERLKLSKTDAMGCWLIRAIPVHWPEVS
jgi:glycosyltransferase involved in cell wall biosynthesis